MGPFEEGAAPSLTSWEGGKGHTRPAESTNALFFGRSIVAFECDRLREQILPAPGRGRRQRLLFRREARYPAVLGS